MLFVISKAPRYGVDRGERLENAGHYKVVMRALWGLCKGSVFTFSWQKGRPL